MHRSSMHQSGYSHDHCQSMEGNDALDLRSEHIQQQRSLLLMEQQQQLLLQQQQQQQLLLQQQLLQQPPKEQWYSLRRRLSKLVVNASPPSTPLMTAVAPTSASALASTSTSSEGVQSSVGSTSNTYYNNSSIDSPVGQSGAEDPKNHHIHYSQYANQTDYYSSNNLTASPVSPEVILQQLQQQQHQQHQQHQQQHQQQQRAYNQHHDASHQSLSGHNRVHESHPYTNLRFRNQDRPDIQGRVCSEGSATAALCVNPGLYCPPTATTTNTTTTITTTGLDVVQEETVHSTKAPVQANTHTQHDDMAVLDRTIHHHHQPMMMTMTMATAEPAERDDRHPVVVVHHHGHNDKRLYMPVTTTTPTIDDATKGSYNPVSAYASTDMVSSTHAVADLNQNVPRVDAVSLASPYTDYAIDAATSQAAVTLSSITTDRHASLRTAAGTDEPQDILVPTAVAVNNAMTSDVYSLYQQEQQANTTAYHQSTLATIPLSFGTAQYMQQQHNTLRSSDTLPKYGNDDLQLPNHHHHHQQHQHQQQQHIQRYESAYKRQQYPEKVIVDDNIYSQQQRQKHNIQRVQPLERDVSANNHYLSSTSIDAISASASKPETSSPRASRIAKLAVIRLPLTPEATVKQFKSLLTPNELKEIYDFPEIYFAGAQKIEKIGGSKRRTGADLAETWNVEGTVKDRDGAVYNSGFDDTRGDLYLTRHDHICYRYEILSLLGKGSFGQVLKCYDHKSKTNVALKIIRNKKRFEKQGAIEVKILKKIRDEDPDNKHSLIHIFDSFTFRGHLCLTFELLGANLYEWLKAGSFRGIHLGVIQQFAKQMLGCLHILAESKIVHCDLKPENILLKDVSYLQPSRLDFNPISPSTSSGRSVTTPHISQEFNALHPKYEIKVIDFGSSCLENERLYTYIQSRFYRSPEVILGIPYKMAIDMWSLGCILAELYTGYPLFPGENEQEQLACIMEIKGVAPPEVLAQGTRTKVFFDSSNRPRLVPSSKGKKRRPSTKTLSSVLKCTDMAFLDFIDRCLCWDPNLRIQPCEAANHPFVTGARFIPPAPEIPVSLSSRKLTSAVQTVVGKSSLEWPRTSRGPDSTTPTVANGTSVVSSRIKYTSISSIPSSATISSAKGGRVMTAPAAAQKPSSQKPEHHQPYQSRSHQLGSKGSFDLLPQHRSVLPSASIERISGGGGLAATSQNYSSDSPTRHSTAALTTKGIYAAPTSTRPPPSQYTDGVNPTVAPSTKVTSYNGTGGLAGTYSQSSAPAPTSSCINEPLPPIAYSQNKSLINNDTVRPIPTLDQQRRHTYQPLVTARKSRTCLQNEGYGHPPHQGSLHPVTHGVGGMVSSGIYTNAPRWGLSGSNNDPLRMPTQRKISVSSSRIARDGAGGIAPSSTRTWK
ncbi:hypothetical protein BASA62_009356 [Batrachochytrium salamandrivorans]|nr:hypothetical protein BASA62_009356 [Batrachochytrium salamandrivorans]